MADMKYPAAGEKIRIQGGKLHVPSEPIIGYIEGDGIGPELMNLCLKVWDQAIQTAYQGQRKVHWCELYLGEKAAHYYDGEIFPQVTLEAIKDLAVIIKGPLTTPVGGGYRSLNVALRQALDLYACVRPVRYIPGVPSPMRHPEALDIVIFRENTEDVYAGIEYEAGTPDALKLAGFLNQEYGVTLPEQCGLGVKPISESGSKRLVRRALQYALDQNRSSVTLMHKGNIMKYTEGAFRNWGYELAQAEFPESVIAEQDLAPGNSGQLNGKVILKDRIADIMFQLLLLRPSEFDVIATPNLNGDYLSDAAAAQVGGVGIAPGANLGDEVAIFEATHGSAPKYRGQNKANPGSLLLSGAMMFDYLGWPEVASLITDSYAHTVQNKIVTYDFARLMQNAREVGSSEFVDHLIQWIKTQS